MGRKRVKNRPAGRPAKRAKTSKLYSVTPVPSGMTVNMVYVQSVNINTGTGFGSEIFRLASIFDPAFSIGGHQPLGHDQWAQLYQRYRVIGADYEVHFVNCSDTNNPQIVGAFVSETSAVGFNNILEYAGGKLTLLQSNEKGRVTFRDTVDIAKFEGDLGSKYDKDYTAAFGTNPVRDIFLHVGGLNNTGGTQCIIEATIKITYKVRLYDKVDLTLS